MKSDDQNRLSWKNPNAHAHGGGKTLKTPVNARLQHVDENKNIAAFGKQTFNIPNKLLSSYPIHHITRNWPSTIPSHY